MLDEVQNQCNYQPFTLSGYFFFLPLESKITFKIKIAD